MTKRYQISTTISPVTWDQIEHLVTHYGTKREVITRAVMLLDAEYWLRVEEQRHPDPFSDIDAGLDTIE